MAAILARDEYSVRRMVSIYRGVGEVGFDIETTGLSPYTNKLVMLIFKGVGKKATIIDVREWEDRGELASLGAMLEPLFDGSVLLVGHNLKFDLGFLMVRCQMQMRNVRVYDTLVTEHVLMGKGTSEVSKSKISMKLDALAGRYDIEMSKEARPWFYEPLPLDQRIEWRQEFPAEQLDYAELDVVAPLRIKDMQQPRLTKMKLIPTAALENRVVPSVAVLSVEGQYLDVKRWGEVVVEATEEAEKLEQYLHTGDLPVDADIETVLRCLSSPDCFEGFDYHILKAREEKQRPYATWKANKEADLAKAEQDWKDGKYDTSPFKNWGELKRSIQHEWNERQPKNYATTDSFRQPPNVGSTDQLLMALHGMGIMVSDTKSETLERLEETFPIVGTILDRRIADKIPTTYGQKMLDTQNRQTGRFYPDWEQYGASTGRFSSRRGANGGYNAQNFPSRGKFKKIKRNIKAPAGWRLVTADFSNIELRILAEMTYAAMGKSNLKKAFDQGGDVHEATARMMFNLPKDIGVKAKAVLSGKVLDFSWRDIAKTINYGLTYGMGAARLAIKLKTTEEIAKELLRKYRLLYAEETAYLKRLKDKVDRAVDDGKTRIPSRTILGRIRWFDLPIPPKLSAKDKASVHAFEDETKEYQRELWNVKLAFANAPIQGTSADITKLAAALLFSRLGRHPFIKFIGIVHDEFILECSLECAPVDGDWPEETWVRRGERILAECMAAACAAFLKHVAFPVPDVVHSHYWTHEELPYMENERWKKWWKR